MLLDSYKKSRYLVTGVVLLTLVVDRRDCCKSIIGLRFH